MSGERPQPSGPSDPVSLPGGLWQRIRQHKMLEWALGYLGAALAIAHGAELVGHTFGWPETLQRLIMGVLIAAFPLVLTLAWFHGHKGLQRVTRGEMMVGSVVLLIGAGLLILLVRTPREGAPASSAEHAAAADSGASAARASAANGPSGQGAQISLAVLPFVNMSTDKDQEYFVDGLSEELLNQIAQIHGIRVIARTSSFAFKGKNDDSRVIAAKLGVNRLLEGSVRKAGNRLRIIAQLVNATDGSNLWSDTYERDLDDVFKVQQDIAKGVVAALSIQLGVSESARPAGGTANVAAYDKYLLARALSRQFEVASALKARQVYREALEIDPNFALAWLGLHRTLYNLITLAPEDPQFVSFTSVARAEMQEASGHIATLAPNAWWTKAMQATQYMTEHKWTEAERAARAAVDVAPASEIDAQMTYAELLAAVGRLRESLIYQERVRELDPLSLEVSGSMQVSLAASGRSQEAQAEFERSKDLPGDHTIWDWWEMRRLWENGADPATVEARLRAYLTHQSLPMELSRTMADTLHDPAAARTAIRRAFNDPASQDGDRMGLLAMYAAHYGANDIAIAAIRKQFLDYRANNFVTLWSESQGSIRADPRFKAILRDMGLVDYWRGGGAWTDFCRPQGADDFVCQ
jgi:adenylate cyclase